jgi:hypothetical protein
LHECDADANKIVVRYGPALDLDCRAAGKGIVGPFVEAANRSAVVSLTVDFKKGAGEKVGRKSFDRKSNGVSSARCDGAKGTVLPRRCNRIQP